MKRTRLLTRSLLLLILVTVTALAVTAVLASNGVYTLKWWTVDTGGGNSAGGSYSVIGTIGQPEAGGLSTGSDYRIIGGVWAGVALDRHYDHVYLPVILDAP